MKATKREKIALVVACVLLVLAFVYAVSTLPTVESKLDGQGNSTGTKATSNKLPMQPPKMEIMSDWSPHSAKYESYRYIKIDGRLALQTKDGDVTFIPETAQDRFLGIHLIDRNWLYDLHLRWLDDQYLRQTRQSTTAAMPK